MFLSANIVCHGIRQVLPAATIALLLVSVTVSAQVITSAEYFFNTDPGQGNATALSIPSGSDVTFTRTVSTTGLPQGFNVIGLRVKESPGGWSLFETRGFYITETALDVPNITAAEYFFDSDPGQGNGIAIPVTTGSTVNFVVPIPTTTLGGGFHFLAIRTKGANGRWGLFEARSFTSAKSQQTLRHCSGRIFIDNDPGIGNGQPITPITTGSTVPFVADIPSSTTPGFHFLAIRVKRRWKVGII